jgi:transcriptional regulator with XRE-family HTH domain
MTPFGLFVRDLREKKGINLKQMAADLAISAAYLSALEHGRKGAPSPMLTRQICTYFGLIWEAAEEAERLASLSHPKVTLKTVGLSAEHTLTANLLAQAMPRLNSEQLQAIKVIVQSV